MSGRGLFQASFLASLFAVSYWLCTIQQPLIDLHDFRQTQTALTALFLQPGLGGLLNYETPVLGYPWSIPFEFPLFQWLVAWLHPLLPLSLEGTGRLVSALFSLLSLLPALGLMRLFGINGIGQSCFVLLYFGSSIYLYWSRTFMIESMALFFAVAALYAYACMRLSCRDEGSHRPRPLVLDSVLLGLSLTLGLLVKVTTILPAVALIGCDLLFQAGSFFVLPRRQGILRLRNPLLAGCCLVLSFFVFKSWLNHADALKGLNRFAEFLTSDRIGLWNYGSLAQRFSGQLWLDVVVRRMFTPLGFVPAVGLMALALLQPNPGKAKGLARAKVLIGLCLILAAAPLLIFANLHIVHPYYQVANQLFLLMAIAASFSIVVAAHGRGVGASLAGIAVVLVLIGNGFDFAWSSGYLQSSIVRTSDKLAVGRAVQAATSPSSVIMVDGDDWSSAFSYYSGRRSLAIPVWQEVYPGPQAVLNASADWLGGRPLGAVITKRHSPQPLDLSQTCRPKAERLIGDWRLHICAEG